MFKRLIIIALVLITAVSAAAVGSAAPREDIVRFSYQNARVADNNGNWTIVDGNHALLAFGRNRGEAEQALRVIKHYRLNEHGFVGRPNASMEYYLSNGSVPTGPMPGEDAVRFDNSNLRVVNVRGNWKIIEGTGHYLLDFGQNEAEAWTALRLIWKYDFNYICFVGRPNASMIYFRR